MKPASRRLSRTLRPTPPGVRPAPMTATEPGASSRWTERASARCSRARCTARERSVGSRSNSRRTTPSSKLRFCGVPGVREHLDHLVVGGQHLGGEAADAALAGDGGDVFEEGGGDTAALVGVLHEEGDLGLVGGSGRGQSVGADAVVAYGGDELAAHRGREPHPVHEVVVGEAVDVLGGQARVRREEAVVLRLVRDLLVEADQALGVVDGDGPDACGAAVAQHHVGLPVGGVLVPVRRGLHGPQSTARVRQRREAVCGRRDSRARPVPRFRARARPDRPGTLHGMEHWSRQP